MPSRCKSCTFFSQDEHFSRVDRYCKSTPFVRLPYICFLEEKSDDIPFSLYLSGPYSKDAMERALFSRVKSASSWLNTPYSAVCPHLLQAPQAEFVGSKAKVEQLALEASAGRVVAAPAGKA